MKWVSIDTPEWQKECSAFHKAKKPFEVRGVRTTEDMTAIMRFSKEKDVYFFIEAKSFRFVLVYQPPMRRN